MRNVKNVHIKFGSKYQLNTTVKQAKKIQSFPRR